MQKIVPCLWFDDQAEEAVEFYMSIFKDAEITQVARYVEDSHGEPGKVMVIDFKLAGQDFMAVNGGPEFKFTEAISLFVNCETQEEVDRCWEKLTEGGKESLCGWLKDKYGLSWQIVPENMGGPARRCNAGGKGAHDGGLPRYEKAGYRRAGAGASGVLNQVRGFQRT